MLFFPPTAELTTAAAPGVDPMAMDGLLLGGALMPPPSAIQHQQQVQTLQLQQQIFAMEQQLQQQNSFPAPDLPPPPPFLPLFNPLASGILAPMPDGAEELKAGNPLLHLNPIHPIYPPQGNSLVQSILPLHQSSPPSALPPAPFPPIPGDQLDQTPAPAQMMAMPPTGPCGFCRLPILDKNFLLIDSQSWHLTCVHCADCGQNLEHLGATCFAKDGFLYCRRDYLAKFGKHCERCGIPIERGELVMRVPPPHQMAPAPSSAPDPALFHVHCFNCILCGQTLAPGEQYTTGPMEQPGGTLYCRAHFQFNPNFQQQPPFGPSQILNPIVGGNSEEESRFLVELNPSTGKIEGGGNEAADPHKSPPGQFGCQQIDANKENPSATELSDQQLAVVQNGSSSPLIDDFGCANSNDAHSNGGGSQKQKRMRTSFKHNQLRTMKHYFNLNHNPDAKDLKQLAMKTGLTKRVLQVWFQNARAKYRRNQQHKIGGGICGALVDSQAASSISLHSHQILLPMPPNGGFQSNNAPPPMMGPIEGEMGQFPMSLPTAQHPSLQILSSSSDPKANSLSPIDGASSSMGASSISLNAGASSADEQSSENSFQ